MDGHAVPLWLSGLPVPALRLHPAEGGLLQLVPRHDRARQNHHQRHRPLSPTHPQTRVPEIHCRLPDAVPSSPLLECCYYWTSTSPAWVTDSQMGKKRERKRIHCSACFVALLIENNTFSVCADLCQLLTLNWLFRPTF